MVKNGKNLHFIVYSNLPYFAKLEYINFPNYIKYSNTHLTNSIKMVL